MSEHAGTTGGRLPGDAAPATAVGAAVEGNRYTPGAVFSRILARIREGEWDIALRDSLIAFGATRLAIALLFVFGASLIPNKNVDELDLTRPDYSGIFSQADGGWYLSIANDGYDDGPFTTDEGQKNWAFFPLYPLSVKAFSEPGIIDDPAVVGIVLSNVFALAALVYIWKLARNAGDEAAARRTVFYMCIFPTSIFLSAVSNMALSLLLFSATLYYLTRERYAQASVASALGVLARGQALFMIPAFAYSIYKSRADWGSRAKAAPALLLMPLALAGFMLYMEDKTGNAYATWDILDTWDRELAPVWDPLLSFLGDPVMIDYHGWNLAPVNFAVTVLALCAVPFVFRKFGALIGVYAAFILLGAVSYSTLQATDRYVLLVVPLFMLLAQWGSREWVDRLVTVTFAATFGMFAILFAAGYYPVLA